MDKSKSIILFLTTILILALTPQRMYGQKQEVDVIYLKNGSIIRGEILEIRSDGQIKVQTLCENIWIFDPDDILKMVKESKEQIAKESSTGEYDLYDYKGIYSSITASLLNGQEDDGPALPYVGFLFTTGYKWPKGAAVGIGLGIEIFDQTYMPFVLEGRYYLKQGNISHYVYLQGGYSYSLDQSSDQYIDYEPSWGYLVTPGVGVQIHFNERNSMSLGVGFRYQKNQNVYIDFNNTEVIRTKQYSRVVFKITYCFR